MKAEFQIVELADEHREWARRVCEEWWGGVEVMSRWVWHDTSKLPGFVAIGLPPHPVGEREGGNPIGLATYRVDESECELITLNSFDEGKGIGAALLDAVREVAKKKRSRRLWLTTSNDNLDAIRFYQKRGFRMVAIHLGAIDAARELKPSIPLVGHYGIPCRDEVEMEEILL